MKFDFIIKHETVGEVKAVESRTVFISCDKSSWTAVIKRDLQGSSEIETSF